MLFYAMFGCRFRQLFFPLVNVWYYKLGFALFVVDTNVEIPMLRHPLYIILNVILILKHFKRMSTTNSAKPNL
jgi:hypothetical protein